LDLGFWICDRFGGRIFFVGDYVYSHDDLRIIAREIRERTRNEEKIFAREIRERTRKKKKLLPANNANIANEEGFLLA